MSFRSLSTRLSLLFAIGLSIAFNGDDASLYFSVSSGQIFYPGDAETAIELSSNGAGRATVLLRAFKIDDPVDFLLAQKDPHSPSLQAGDPPNTFEMLGLAVRKATRDARYAARTVMPAASRRALRDVTDLNATRAQRFSTARSDDPQRSAPVDDVPKGAERYRIVASWEYKIVPEDDDSWHYDRIPAPVRDKGVYLIEARIRGKRALTVLIVSEYAMVVKQSRTELMSFVVNSRTGEKVEGVPIVVSRGGEQVAESQTGSDGSTRVPLAQLPPSSRTPEEEEDWQWEYRRRQVLVVGERDGNIVVSDPYYYSYDEGRSRTYIHTDRPVYRPGQTVYWRGILRTVDDNGAYATPRGGDSVLVTIDDGRGTNVRTDTTMLSDLGTFSGNMALNDAAPLGSWSIGVRRIGAPASSAEYSSFEVEEYKKPEYKVVVETDRTNYTRGDRIIATARANYYFGSPVTTADIEYFVYRAQYWRPWWRGSDWAYLFESGNDDFATYRMEMVASGTGTIGSDGTFRVEYETSKQATRDYAYRIQVNVVDNSRRSISGAKSVEVTRGEFWVSTRTDKQVYRIGDEAKIAAEARTFDGDRPVATPFSVNVKRTWWDRKKDDSVPDRFIYVRRSESIWKGTGSTGVDGKGTATYLADRAGYFEVEVTARDARGTEIVESSYLYVADARFADWYREGSGDVQIIPDREAYRPGDELTALIVMPAPNVDALVTLEGAAIFDSRIERLTGTSAVVHFTLKDEYAPAVYLSASAIVNNEMYSDSRRISVVPDGKVLKVDIAPDRELYRPGSKGTITVRARDEKGDPARNVELSIGMVDEAIYAIQPDITPDIQRFFYGPRWNEVETSSSLNFAFYGEGRRIDPDAVDALYGSINRRPGDRFLARAGSRLASRAIAYGDVKGEMFIQPNVRRLFKDMMFWTPSIRTDDEGRAEVTVEFPDNLTTWRINVRAIGQGTSVGTATSRVIARKDIMVRMETPRFLVAGDSLLIATTVHNYLKTEKTARIEFSAVGATASETSTSQAIPAGGEVRVDWKVYAPASGEARMQVRALTDEESDALELSVPVLPAGMRIGTGLSAELTSPTESKSMTLNLPNGTDTRAASLTISMTPSLAGALLGSLDELIGYPYGCVEQTMSRFLPTLVVADVLAKTGAPMDSGKRTRIPAMVERGMTKLAGMQHNDGGWGWWENDHTDPYMTAYVIFGLTVARECGYTLRGTFYEAGCNSLRQQIESGASRQGAKLNAAEEAYVLRAIARVERNKPTKLITDRIRALMSRDTLGDYGRALLAQAAIDQGMRGEANTIVSALERRAHVDDNGTHWGPVAETWHWFDDPVEATATVVRAIFDVRGQTDQTKSAIRWILTQKRGTAWHNTRQTSTVIFSLVDLLKSTGELTPDYSVVVRVNGNAVLSRRITSDDLYRPEIRLEFVGSNLQEGTNTIVVDKRGNGRLIASARVLYYAAGAALRPSSAGFRVAREYSLLTRERRGEVIVYTKSPFTGRVRSGQELLVNVTVVPERWYEYVMMEDPIPAGCEVVANTNGYTIVGEPEYDLEARKKKGEYAWLWWYAAREIRDERVAFFAREVERREYRFSYVMRAQIPGDYAVMPSTASLMYYPEVRGNGSPGRVTIVK